MKMAITLNHNRNDAVHRELLFAGIAWIGTLSFLLVSALVIGQAIG